MVWITLQQCEWGKMKFLKFQLFSEDSNIQSWLLCFPVLWDQAPVKLGCRWGGANTHLPWTESTALTILVCSYSLFHWRLGTLDSVALLTENSGIFLILCFQA